jgi:hypothetical protein
MKSQIVFTILFIMGLSVVTSGQVSGISSSKLSVPRAEILEKGSFEFEPAFLVAHSSNCFNESGDVCSINGDDVASALAFRVTFGISENFEIGSLLPSNIENIGLGAKYNYLNSDFFKTSVIAGLGLPAGNTFLPDTTHNENHYSASIGNVFSFSFSEEASADVMISYTNIIGDHAFNSLLSFQSGFGYYLTEEFQLIGELNGMTAISDGMYSGKLSVAPGFSYSVTNSLGIATGVQYDIFGKNELQSLSYFAAFTILFN